MRPRWSTPSPHGSFGVSVAAALGGLAPCIRLVCDHLRMRVDSRERAVDALDDELVELAVEVFSMLADPTRVRIVLALQPGELSVSTLADVVEKSPTAVSQHLAKMRLSRLVTTRREGNRIFYRLANEHVSRLVVDALFQAEHSVVDQPRHHHTTEKTDD